MKGAVALLFSLLVAHCAVCTSVTLVDVSDESDPDKIIVIDSEPDEEIDFVKRQIPPAGETIQAVTKTFKPMSKNVKNALKIGGGAAFGVASGIAGTLGVQKAVRSSRARSGAPTMSSQSSPDMGAGGSFSGSGETTMYKRSPQGGSEIAHSAEHVAEAAGHAVRTPLSKGAKTAMKVFGGFSLGSLGTGAIISARKSSADRAMTMNKRAMPGTSQVTQATETLAKSATPMGKYAKSALQIGAGAVTGALTTAALSKRAVTPNVSSGGVATSTAVRRFGRREDDDDVDMIKREGGEVVSQAVHAAEDAVKHAKHAKPALHKGLKTAMHVAGGAAAGIAGTLGYQHFRKSSTSPPPSFDSAPMKKRSLVTADQSSLVKRVGGEDQVVGKAIKSGGRQVAAMYGVTAGGILGGIAGWQANQAKQNLITSTEQRVLRDPALARVTPSIPDIDHGNKMVKRGGGISAQDVSPLFAGAKHLLKGPHGKSIGLAAGFGGTALIAGHLGHEFGHAGGYADGVGAVINSGATQNTLAKRSPLGMNQVAHSAAELSSSASSSGVAGHQAISHGSKVVGKSLSKAKMAIAAGAAGTMALVGGIIHGKTSAPSSSSSHSGSMSQSGMGQGGMYRKREVNDDGALQRRAPMGVEKALGGKIGTALMTGGATALFAGGYLTGKHLGTLEGKTQALERGRGSGGGGMYYKKRELLPSFEGTHGSTTMHTRDALRMGAALAASTGNPYVGFSRRPMSGTEAMYYKRDLDKRSPTFEQGLANTLKGAGAVAGISSIAYVGHKIGKHFRSRPNDAMPAPSTGGAGMSSSGMGMYKRDQMTFLQNDNKDKTISGPALASDSSSSLQRRSRSVRKMLLGAAVGGAVVHHYHKKAKKRHAKKQKALLAEQQ